MQLAGEQLWLYLYTCTYAVGRYAPETLGLLKHNSQEGTGSQVFDVTCRLKYRIYISNPDVESYRLVYK